MFKKDKQIMKLDKILFTETKSKFHYPYQNWYFPLKRHCNKMLSFDIRLNYLFYGKDDMNRRFLKFIKKEKPDAIFLWISSDELYFETFFKIRKFSPKTKIFMVLQDDDSEFEDYSRYFILFADYGLIFHKRYIPKYKKEGVQNVIYCTGIDTGFFKPMNIEKKYDVTFIGYPKSELSKRYEYIKFLKDNNVNIKLFGRGWENYPEFKDIYKGILNSNEMVKVLNQSKIHLNLTKNSYGKSTDIKAKIFEGGACNTFVLTEFFDGYRDLFKEGKEMIMFKNKQDLLDKIKYYLKNEKERGKISNEAYKRIIKTYSLDVELKKIFKIAYKKNKNLIKLPELNKKIISLSEKDLKQNLNELSIKLKDYDFITFKKGKCQELKYRNYLQAYSLVKTNKPISCCNYYVYSKGLKDYLYFRSKVSIKINKEKYNSCLNINQLMIAKKYFFKNLNAFKKIMNNGKIDFVNDKNTVFVSYPLIRINKLAVKDHKTIKKMFDFKFLYTLYSLKHKKQLFLNPYLLFLFKEIVFGKIFILKIIIETLKDKSKRVKLNTFIETG